MNSPASVQISESQILTEITKIPMFIPPSLHVLLAKVKEINQISSLDQVLEAMKDYIFMQKLFDVKNPRIIHCQNDELGMVLGIPQFSLWDIKKIVLQKLLSENSDVYMEAQPCTSNSVSKRKAIDDLPDSTKKSCPNRCPSPMFLFIPSSPIYDSSSETNLSIQDYETAYVKDTSDDTWCSEDDVHSNNMLAIQQMYEVEYEVESVSSGGSPVSDTDSEIEDIVQAAITSVICKTDSDMEFWADDSSDEDFGSDLEISTSDKWKCKKCGSFNKPPMRFCQKCWDQRVGWLPDRKERRRRPRQKLKALKQKDILTGKELSFSNKMIEGVIVTREDFEPGTVIGTDASGSSQELFVSEMSQDLCKEAFEDSSTSQSQDCNSQSSKCDTGYTDSKLCIICCTKPKNATIIHGKIGHQLSCYRCARKLLSQNKPCPVCRRSIDRVVHQILVA